MSQEKKKSIAADLKLALKNSGIKYTLAVRHYSTIVMTIQSGPVDFIQNYIDTVSKNPHWTMYHNTQTPRVNPKALDINSYWYQDHFTGKSLDLLKTMYQCLNRGNHDRSDMQSDYFDVGWYVTVNIGTYKKPYTLVSK